MGIAGWVCRRCERHFPFGLSMCPACTGTAVDREVIECQTNPSTAGTDSSASTKKPPMKSSPAATSSGKSAQTTENPSDPGPVVSSTAPSMVTVPADQEV